MSDDLDTQSLPYLPIEVSGQIFAIPMSEVTTTRQLSNEDITVFETGKKGQATIPIIDLRHLFFPANRPGAGYPAYMVVISIPGFIYTVLVDDVRTARRAALADQLAIPPLIAGRRYPFSGVIREAGSLVLLIHSRFLAEELRRVKPDLVPEQTHVS